MLFDFQNGTDWTQVKQCRKCNVLPQIKCDLEWIQLTCLVCGRRSMTHITYGTKVAIDDWNRYYTEDWYK